jgi:hypothetical protein
MPQAVLLLHLGRDDGVIGLADWAARGIPLKSLKESGINICALERLPARIGVLTNGSTSKVTHFVDTRAVC